MESNGAWLFVREDGEGGWRERKERKERGWWGDNPDVKTYSGSILGLMS